MGYEVQPESVRDPSVDSGIPGGNLLLRLVDALLTGREPLAPLHQEIIDVLGPEALVDAAGVFGNFEMMNRVADATGIPVPAARVERERHIVDAFGLHHFMRH